MKQAALYVRVSTKDQTCENQIQVLRQVAKDRGWKVKKEHIFIETGKSGKLAREDRPEFDKLCTALAAGEFEVVGAWHVDRLGRSLIDLMTFLQLVHAHKADLYVHQSNIDTTTPAGKAMFQMMGVFAEFERSLICARVKEGMARVKAEGKVLNAHKKTITPEMDEKILHLRGLGYSCREIARLTGASSATVSRRAKENPPQLVRP